MTLCVVEKETKRHPFEDSKMGKSRESNNITSCDTWTQDQRFPKIHIEECGLTVQLKGYNKHRRKGRAKRGNSLPSIYAQESIDSEDAGKKEGLLGAKFCRYQDEHKHYSDNYDERFPDLDNQSSQYVDYMQIGKLTDKYPYRSISHGFEPPTGIDQSEQPIARLRYHHRDREEYLKTSSDKDDGGNVVNISENKRNRRNAKENAVIRRLALKRSKQKEHQRQQRVSTSYGERPTKSTDIWVSNQEMDGTQTYPMPEFLRQLYETRDAFIETLRSRSGADKIAANVRLAQEFTRDRIYRSRFDSGLPQRIEQRKQQHNLDCPLCLNYVPTYHGHRCPPNTPFNKERLQLKSRESTHASIPETIKDKTDETQDLVVRRGPNHLASLVIHSL